MARRTKRPRQLSLPLDSSHGGRGGVRQGAGRKPAVGRRNVRHRTRAVHVARHPVHVVLRSKVRPLRSQFVFPTLRRALARAARAIPGFRVVHFSVQYDHLHLLIEAENKAILSRGMQGLAIRLAKKVNALLGRHGKVWADRFFARALTSPRAVRNALAYVLNNFRKHARTGTRSATITEKPVTGRFSAAFRIDPYSSAPYFRGFRELRERAPCELPRSRAFPLTPPGVLPLDSSERPPVVPSETWLAKSGWRRAGSVGLFGLGRDERSERDRGIGA